MNWIFRLVAVFSCLLAAKDALDLALGQSLDPLGLPPWVAVIVAFMWLFFAGVFVFKEDFR